MEAQTPSALPLPDELKRRRGRETGGGWEITQVLTDLATSTDSSRGRTIGNSGVRVSQQDQAHSGRKGPLQRGLKERTHKEAPEVLARDGSSL